MCLFEERGGGLDILGMIEHMIINVLLAIYQGTFFSVLLSIGWMFLYLHAFFPESAGNGIKASILLWCRFFKSSNRFRQVFFLVFWISMILFRTLLNRDMWVNPIINVLGDWGLTTVDSNGQIIISTECIENCIMFVPFSYSLSLVYSGENGIHLIKRTTIISFIFSLSIELVQLFFRLGTFQISDIFYNTLGGLLGSCSYRLIIYLKNSIDK